MTTIIGFTQIKGGVGRSTLATNLAGELAKIAPTALVDCDMPQGTSALWARLRADPKLTLRTADDRRTLVGLVEQLSQEHDYLVLDGPPRITELTRAILLMSDLSLVPVGASRAELWATELLLPLIDQARQVRDIDVRLVWNRFRGYLSSAHEIARAARNELKLNALYNGLGYRVAYSDAMAVGKTAAERPDRAARSEIACVVGEVKRIIYANEVKRILESRRSRGRQTHEAHRQTDIGPQGDSVGGRIGIEEPQAYSEPVTQEFALGLGAGG